MTDAAEPDELPRVRQVGLRVADPALQARVLALLDATEAVQLAPASAADAAEVIVTDDAARSSTGGAAVVLLTDDGAVARRALAGGAAVLPPRVARSTLLAAIEAAAQGLVVADPALVAPVPEARAAPAPPSPPPPSAAANLPELTAREREVLALLAEGASNKAIARRLAISVHTVKFHVGAILEKLDATGRTDAVAHAVRLGLILL
jgi:DNA-binding NarL/FixJ family response regulator